MFASSPLSTGAALLGYSAQAFQNAAARTGLLYPGQLSLTEFATNPSPSGLKETIQLLAAALDLPLVIDREQAKKLQALIGFAQEYCSPRDPGAIRTYHRPLFVDPGDGKPFVLHELSIQHIVDSNEHLAFVSFEPRAVRPPPPQTPVQELDIKRLPIERGSLIVGIDSRSYILDHDDAITIPHALLTKYDLHLCAPDDTHYSPGFLISPAQHLLTGFGATLPTIKRESIASLCGLKRQALNKAHITVLVDDKADRPPKFYEATIQGVQQDSGTAFTITNHGPARCFVTFRAKDRIARAEADRMLATPQDRFSY